MIELGLNLRTPAVQATVTLATSSVELVSDVLDLSLEENLTDK